MMLNSRLFRTHLVRQVAAVAALCCASAFAEGPKVELIGIGQFDGQATDRSGQNDQLENGEPHNRLGGFSALAYSGTGHRYAALPDRGPDDGATGYLCRYHLLDILVDPTADSPVKLELIETNLFSDRQGRPFTGSAAAIKATKNQSGRLDPEGFRFASDGRFFVSDEYGPQLVEFSPRGKEVRRFAMPSHLTVLHPADSKAVENELNVMGRSSNKGMEGLGLSPDGRWLYGIMQSVLLQDGPRNELGYPLGVNCRMVKIEVATGEVKEYVYQLDAPTNGLNEIVAMGDDQFLVIERDGKVGELASFKKVMKIDLAGATEIQDMDRLPHELPESIRPVRKETFIDFLSPEFQLAPQFIPEKLEGLTFGERLPDGRQTLVVASDNDFEAAAPSLIYVFGLNAEATAQLTAR